MLSALLRSWLLYALLTVSLFACAQSKPARPTIKAPVPAPIEVRAVPVSPSIFLWHAKHPHKAGDLWLLGSMHVQRAEQAVIDRAVFGALRSCSRAAFELDFDAVDMSAIAGFVQSEGMLPKGQSLRDVVSDKTFALWSEVATTLKINRQVYEQFRPWTAALMLQIAFAESEGFHTEHAVDRLVYALAKQEPSRPRQIIGLETALEQMVMLRDGSSPAQEAMLASTLRDIQSGEARRLADLYVRGDEPGIAKLFDDLRREAPELKAFFEGLLDRRNHNMAARLSTHLEQPGCTFVTVGAGHLVGETGLVRLLEQQGLTLTSIAPQGKADASVQALAKMRARPSESAQDGFRVELPERWMLNEITPPEAPAQKVRSYVVPRGSKGALVVTVRALAQPTSKKSLHKTLTQAAETTLRGAQLVLAPPQPMQLAGEQAVMLRGTSTEHPTHEGRAVALIHLGKLYLLSGLALGDDVALNQTIIQDFERMLETFQWLDSSLDSKDSQASR